MTSDHDAPDGAPAPFQFGLRALLLWVAAIGALFAVLSKVRPIWQATIVWFLVLVAAHVAANVRGSRHGARQHRAEPEPSGFASEPPAAKCLSPRFAQTTRLGKTARLGRATVAMTLVGLFAGGSLGTAGFAWISWERSGYAGVLLAGVSSAVVGGFLAFLSSSFLLTAVQALREAAGHGQPPDSTIGDDLDLTTSWPQNQI